MEQLLLAFFCETGAYIIIRILWLRRGTYVIARLSNEDTDSIVMHT